MQWFRDRRVRGRPPHPDVLTPAEWRVLEHVREGMPNAEIAVRLGLSVPTVKTHVSSMLAKLELRDRSELAAWTGEPAEASRSALARLGLGAPLGWLREGLGASWPGKAPLVAGVAAISVGGYVAVAGLSGAGGGGLVAPSATETATATAEPEPTVAVATETPTGIRELLAEGARQQLAEWMDERLEDIEVLRVEQGLWRNACPREPIPGHECPFETDGFQITLAIRGGDPWPQVVNASTDEKYVWVPQFGETAHLTEVDVSQGIVEIDVAIVGGPSRILPGTQLGVPLSELEPGDLVSFGLTYGAPGTDAGVVVWMIPAPEPVPVGTETGIAGVDEIIALYMAGDADGLESRVIYREVPCVEEPQLDDVIQCAEDEEPGTLVTAFSGAGGCHGGHLRPDEVSDYNPARRGPSVLFGVLGPEDPEESDPRHMAIFVPPDVSPAVGGHWAVIDDGMILVWGGGCNSAEQYLEFFGGRVILHGPAKTDR